MRATSPARVFISYAHADDALRRKLETHLAALKNNNLIEVWSDRQIDAGTEWEPSIRTKLEQADIILLLVSPDFLASDFCQREELKRAMARHTEGQVRVIPVFLRPCDWKGAAFGGLQGIPDDAKPVTSFGDRDRAFTRVAAAVRKAANDLRSARHDGKNNHIFRGPAPSSSHPYSTGEIAGKDQPSGDARTGSPEPAPGPGLGESAAYSKWEPPPNSSPSPFGTAIASLKGFVAWIARGLIARLRTVSATPIRGRPRLIIASAVVVVLLLIGFFTFTGEKSEITEMEPNDIFLSATELRLGQSAIGSISSEKDVDFYNLRFSRDFSGSVELVLRKSEQHVYVNIDAYNESFDRIPVKRAYSLGEYSGYMIQIPAGVGVLYVSIRASQPVSYGLSVLQRSSA